MAQRWRNGHRDTLPFHRKTYRANATHPWSPTPTTPLQGPSPQAPGPQLFVMSPPRLLIADMLRDRRAGVCTSATAHLWPRRVHQLLASAVTGWFYDSDDGWIERAKQPVSFWMSIVATASLGLLILGVGFRWPAVEALIRRFEARF